MARAGESIRADCIIPTAPMLTHGRVESSQIFGPEINDFAKSCDRNQRSVGAAVGIRRAA